MADVLETRLRHAQTEKLAPIDLISTLASDEWRRRRLLRQMSPAPDATANRLIVPEYADFRLSRAAFSESPRRPFLIGVSS
jgi:hypothetical protein